MGGGERGGARDGAEVRMHPPALYLGAALLGVVLHWTWALGFARGSSVRVAVGVAVACVGVALLGSASSVFRRLGQHPDPRKPTSTIARDGPYRFTRNPMYLGGALAQLGLGIALGNGWILLLLIPVVALVHRRVILREEQYLERKFGDDYLRFKASVRRWI
jgi:protein-S-isoprenylcysteine O-methyltransferase Ste14